MILLKIFDRQSTLGVYVLLVLAIPVRTQCPECTGHIKRVNITTEECIDCFPCPSCDSVYTSSVPCGATVPFGAEIKCVLIQSDPVFSATASTQTPATSIDHHTTSSSASTRSRVGTDRSDTTEKQKSEKDLASAEWKKDSRIYIFGGIFIAVAFVVVLYMVFKRKSRKQSPLPRHTRPDPSSPTQSQSDVLPQENETNTAAFRHHNDCISGIGQGSSEENSKSPATPQQLAAPAVKPTEQTSQLSPVVEKDMGSEMAVCGLSVELPIQSTEGNRGYNTHVKDVPESVIRDMCMLLDEERDIDGKDYKLLASELELTPVKIRYLKGLKQMQGNSPSYVLLMQVFSARENLGTLRHLCSILKKMERFDVLTVLDDWVVNNS